MWWSRLPFPHIDFRRESEVSRSAMQLKLPTVLDTALFSLWLKYPYSNWRPEIVQWKILVHSWRNNKPETPNNKQKIDNIKLRTYNSQPGTDKIFYIKFSIINHPYF